MCGEKDRYDYKAVVRKGSPPRVRGEAARIHKADGRRGITPACAGRRRKTGLTQHRPGDHPRVCGEKAPFSLSVPSSSGSPPRVRGEARRQHVLGQHDRITPACAGRSVALIPPCMRPEDHPRVCGEKLVIFEKLLKPRGSPPRVRGEGLRAGDRK